MSNLPASEQKQFIRSMFGRIAPSYDLMNRIMTAGQDLRWRKEAIRHAKLPAGGLVMDLGAGTGDLAREVLRQQPACRLVCADLTLEMMHIGQVRTQALIGEGAVLGWSAADAQALPFPGDCFEAVVSGFLLRNVHDVRQSLADQYRVIKAGGWIVALDTNPPPRNMLTPLINFHLHTVIPALGRIIAGHPQEYLYLPASTEGFLQPEELSRRFIETGFVEVGFERLMLGTVSIHWGQKPLNEPA
ncbi:MAG: hypothetical protein A2Z16_02915 [Chloroflexi bacterium RBG_16_54_18]|nr:MAG: hypothetical protein A2Z16_02915 [Chloroflexi bacterium RBG_16_54_18]